MIRKYVSSIYQRLPIIRELNQIKSMLAAQHNYANATQLIKLVDFELHQHPRYNDPKRLLRFQAQVCSQGHEDGIIHEIFRRIESSSRVFAEIGVGNGNENNTAFLLSQGWNGFWVDGNPAFIETLAQRKDIPKSCLKYHVGFVYKENVAQIFENLGVPKELALLSLDIDQNTYYLWQALEAYQAQVVVVEYNAAVPADIDWKVNYEPQRVWSGTQNMGASLKAYENLGRRLGYSLVGCDFAGNNAFFVRNDLVGEKFAAPFTAENHYEPPRFTARRFHPNAILDRALSN